MLSDPYSLPLLLAVHQTHTELGEMQAVLVQALLPGQLIQPIAADRASRHCRKEIFYYLGLLCLSELMLGRANDAPNMVSLLPVQHKSHQNHSFYRASGMIRGNGNKVGSKSLCSHGAPK